MRRRKPNRRRGNVLLLFALFAFALFAVVGMALDLGFARLTQRQMQAGVDSAAREGMRFRDEIPQAYLNDAAFLAQVQPECGAMPGTPQSLTDPAWMAWRENVRRWLARNQINLAYADGTDAATANPIQYGAGPELQITGGVGDANAFQTITPPKTGDVIAYKPTLQLNADNDPVGDLVALNSGVNPNFPVGTTGNELDNYQQKNFTVADKTAAPQADSFLVRLRRTNDTHGNVRNPVDNQPGISTSGSALPLIFAQGSLVAGKDSTQGYSPRHDGITVRATAIAQGRPVVAVGKAVPNDPITGIPGVSGAALFSIKLSDWISVSTFNSSLVSFYVPVRSMVFVGDSLAPIAGGALPGKDSNQVYVPLVNTTNQVAGFGYVTYNLDGTATKQVPRMAAENATTSMAVFRPNSSDPTIPDPTLISSLLSKLMDGSDPNQKQLLMAPALVR